jgi:hypothetical protein
MKKIALSAAGLMVATTGLMFASFSPAEAQSRGAPRGSYTASCSGAYVNQGRLYADCRDRSGRTRESSIELNRCSSSDIGNDNGLLTCYNHRGRYEDGGRPGGNNGPGRPGDDNRPGRPGSGWDNNSAITIYRDANYRGQSMTLRGEVSNLRSSGMNDAISSIRISRGDWEICTDANFRGDCRVIRGDQRDLSRMGLNDKISSLRPARRGGGNR